MSLSRVQQALTGSVALTAIAGNRITQTILPQTFDRPYVVWFVATAVPDNTLSERPQRDDQRIQIDCYSKSQPEAAAMKEAIVDAVEVIGYIVYGPWNTYEVETGLFRWSLDLEFLNPR